MFLDLFPPSSMILSLVGRFGIWTVYLQSFGLTFRGLFARVCGRKGTLGFLWKVEDPRGVTCSNS